MKKMKKQNKIILLSAATLMAAGVIGGSVALFGRNDSTSESSIKKQDAWEVGVRFTGTETQGVRLGDAQGKVAGINGLKNDFDSMPIYGQMTTSIIDGEYIVSVPKFYVKHVVHKAGDIVVEEWHVSNVKIDDDYEVPIAFLNAKQKEMDKFTLGAFMASLSEDGKKLESRKGKHPATNISLQDARPLAEANNSHIAELRKADAVNILMMIEFATRNMQDIMKGISFLPDLYPTDNEYNDLSEPADYFIFSEEEITGSSLFGLEGNEDISISDFIYPGKSYRILDDNEGTPLAEGVVKYVSSISINDVDCIKIGLEKQFVSNESLYPTILFIDDKTGQTLGLSGSSKETNDIDGIRHFSYRGLEDWYGMYYEWTDGRFIKIHNHQFEGTEYSSIVECFDPAKYHTCNTKEGEYEPSFVGCVEIGQADISGVPSHMKKTVLPGILIPMESHGDEKSGYSDYMSYSCNNSNSQEESYNSQVFCRGGLYCDEFDGCGPFRVDWGDSSGANGYDGFRLSYDK